MSMVKKKVIIDTDPGHDDALALLLMLCAVEIDVQLITTVAGNSTIQNCTNNAYFVRDIAGRNDVPIASGASQPLRRPLKTAIVHGGLGLDGVKNVPLAPLDHNAVKRILKEIGDNPNEITLLALGPQTNIAQAILENPSTMSLARNLIIMGGAFDVPGNQTSTAEFNIFSDPEAARIVADFPIPKTYVPLDVCNEIQVSIEEFRRIASTRLRSVILAMTEPYIRNLNMFELPTRGALMYDVLAAYCVLTPELCEGKAVEILVEIQDSSTIGRTTALESRTAISNIVQSIPCRQFIDDFFSVINTGERVAS